jgi:flagellar M-ring protein FliF
VTADMNYNHMSETSETFDPDSKVVRSTQTVEQNSSDTNSGNTNAVSVANALPNQQNQVADNTAKSTSGRTEETTNYEISKTTKTSTVDGGTVKRLSVAVVVDGAKGEGDYRPRTSKELAQIEALVKSAMGFDQTRGDQLQVSSMAFAKIDTEAATAAPAPLLGLDGAYWFKIIEAAILSVTALLIGLFVLRPLIARMFAPVSYAQPQIAQGSPVAGQIAQHAAAPSAQGDAALQQPLQPAAIPPPRESMIDISRIEGQVRESSVKKVGEVVQAHPEEALAILRSWLHQPV